MKSFILCGGFGTRLRSIVSGVPKPMASFDGTPFLEIIVQNLIDKGVSSVVFLAGYLADHIKFYFEEKCKISVPVNFSIEVSPLGTGGAVKKAAHDYLHDEEVLVVNGDTFFDLNLGDLVLFHQRHNGCVSIVLSKVNCAHDYGSVTIDDSGRITSFKEKTKTDHAYVFAGYYLASRQYFNFIPENSFVSAEQDIFPELVCSGQLYGLCQDQEFFDIGTPERFKKFESWNQQKS
jgi:NDP-sugar pyrophosphorylase family protein